MIDTSSGVLFIYVDRDTKMVYLAGKGDGNIRYFEYEGESPYVHFLTDFKTSAPQRGLGMMPKRGLKVLDCEITRFYKLHPKGFIEPISMIVPRKAPNFQEDLYPDTKEDVATMTADEWLGGANTPASTVSLKNGIKVQEAKKLATIAAVKVESPIEDVAPKGEKELTKAYHEQKKEIEDLKRQLASAEIKIRQLSKN